MYADDLAYLKPLTSDQAREELTKDMKNLAEKYDEIELALNAKKTKCMLMSPSNAKVELEVTIGGERIEQVDNFRYLGVDLDPKMSYRNHVKRMVTKTKQMLGALCRTIRKCAPLHVFGKLYKSTIEPLLTYAIEAWYPSQVVLQNSLERVKKYAAKLTANNFEKPYKELLQKLNWKPLCKVATERRAILVHSYVHAHRSLPEDAIVKRSDLDLWHSSRLGHSLQLTMPATNMEAVKSSSLNTTKRIWNALPDNVATISDQKKFRRAVQEPTTYQELAKKKKIRRVEEEI